MSQIYNLGKVTNGFIIKGYYFTFADLQASINNPASGDAYGVGSADPYTIYVWDGVSAAWVDNGTIKGDKGDTGSKGDTGDKGDTGATGPTGADGTTFTPDLAVNGDLSWSNTDGKANPSPVNIKGPQGEQGHGLIINGYYSTLAALESAVPSPGTGEAYGIGSASPYDIYIWDSQESIWLNFGPLEGPNRISLETDSDIAGLLKGSGGKVKTAVAGTDYQLPTNNLSQGDILADNDLVPFYDASEHGEKKTSWGSIKAFSRTTSSISTSGILTAAGYYTVAETAIDPAGYYAKIRLTVTSTASAEIAHQILVTITGHGSSVPSVNIDSSTLTEGNSASSGIKYLRVAYPATEDNGYKVLVDINTYNATSREVTVELLEARNISLTDPISVSGYDSLYQNAVTSSSLYFTGNFITGGFYHGTVSGSVDTATSAKNIFNTGYQAGEALSEYDIVYLGTDNKWYKCSVAGRSLPINSIFGSCDNDYIVGSAATVNLLGYFGLPISGLGTINLLKPLYLQGVINGSTLTTTGVISTETAANYSYIRLGNVLNATNYLYFDGANIVSTIDAEGNLVSVDNVAIGLSTQDLTAETNIEDSDTLPFYDTSVTEHRKSTWGNMVAKLRIAVFGTTSGILKADGSGAVSVAVAGTDYQTPTDVLIAESALADADVLPFYDNSATAHRKVTWANIISAVITAIVGVASKAATATPADADNTERSYAGRYCP